MRSFFRVLRDSRTRSRPGLTEAGCSVRQGRLGREALAQVTCVAKPDTILAWRRKLIAKKFDGSKHRRYPGRPPIEPNLEQSAARLSFRMTPP
jgi:hypothetical protein